MSPARQGQEGKPPGIARFLLQVSLPSHYREEQLGDLAEGFAARRRTVGPAAARRWYWRQVVRSLGPNLVTRFRHARSTHSTRRGGSSVIEILLQDLRYGVRSMIKNPTFAVVSTVTLALAIGVNVAIFSLVNAVVLAGIPMQDPSTAIIFRNTNVQLGVERGPFSFPEFLSIREQAQSFEGVAAWRGGQWILTSGDEPVRVDGYQITDGFLDVWRLGIAAGRGFLPGEDQLGAGSVAMLSHGFWTRQYAAREDAIGSQIRLDGEEYTVVGVMSPELEFSEIGEAEIWMPLKLDVEAAADRERRDIFVTGRLKAMVSGQQAHEEVLAIGARLAESFPATNRGWEPHAIIATDALLSSEAKTILLLLVLTVSLVLLIACANVANMLLARATARSREMALRSALGAARIRLVRQLLTESLVIGLSSAVIGLGLSRVLMWALIAISNGQESAFTMAVVDGNVLLFTLTVSLVTPLAFGLIPALRGSADDTASALKEGGQRSGGRKGNRLRSVLVGAQVSVALMLMVVAGLLVRTVVKLQQLELGFDSVGVLSMRIGLPEAKYGDADARRQFFEGVTRGIAGLPGVDAVALAGNRPVAERAASVYVEIEGRPPADEADRLTAQLVVVTPEYFDLLGIPTVSGRSFTANDAAESFHAALVAQEIARRYWPNDDPVGRRIRMGLDETAPWIQIVGVVADIQSSDIETEETFEPLIYRPFAQAPRAEMIVFARGPVDPLTLSGPVRDAVWAVDPDQPTDDIRTMEQALWNETATGYAILTLFVTFGLFALCMAAVGIYGVMSYAVAQRAGEIGIRIALGAGAGNVRMMILKQGGKLLVVGAAAGLAGALVVSRLLSGLVFGISSVDPVTFVGVPVVLLSVGMIANYIPALRATRIDPMRTLRTE